MIFQNIARQQITKDKTKSVVEQNRTFFDEYFRAFDDEEKFRRDLPKAIDRARSRDTRGNIERIVEAARDAQELIEPVVGQVLGDDADEMTLYIIIGRGMWDGHGLTVGDGPSLFLDMTLMNEHLRDDRFALDTHLVHEMTHAIHYHLCPDFFPALDKPVHRRVLDQFAAEGIATRLSRRLTGCDERRALWFGSLDDDEFTKWQEHAESVREELGARIHQLLEGDHLEELEELNEKLFRIPGELLEGRVGYLYGRDIVQQRADGCGLAELFETPSEEWDTAVGRYFGADHTYSA